MGEILKGMNVFDTSEGKKTLTDILRDKSRRYAIPNGFWTLEVFHNDHVLIPEDRVDCEKEPQLEQRRREFEVLGSSKRFIEYGKAYWEPVHVVYHAFGGEDVGSMLINDHEELQMVHHARGELTYWLGVDKPDRTWMLKDWLVTAMNVIAPKSVVTQVHVTFMFSEASLLRY
jgi:hypothetical protein